MDNKEEKNKYLFKYFPVDTKKQDTNEQKLLRNKKSFYINEDEPPCKMEELKNVITNLKKRAAGKDGISNETIKELEEKSYIKIDKWCIETKIFPKILEIGPNMLASKKRWVCKANYIATNN